MDPSGWRNVSIRTRSSAAAAGAGQSAAIRLDGGLQAALSPEAFNIPTARSTSEADGVVSRRAKSRLTVVSAFAGPTSTARAIACASVGAGLEIPIGPGLLLAD